MPGSYISLENGSQNCKLVCMKDAKLSNSTDRNVLIFFFKDINILNFQYESILICYSF